MSLLEQYEMRDSEMGCVSKKKKKKMSKEQGLFKQLLMKDRIPQQERRSAGMTEDKEHF